jgi:hypothetical protein
MKACCRVINSARMGSCRWTVDLLLLPLFYTAKGGETAGPETVPYSYFRQIEDIFGAISGITT